MSRGILGTQANLLVDINLLVQVAVLFMLCAGAWLARKGRLNAHQTLMTAAVVINAAAIVFVMDPSFFRLLPVSLHDAAAPRALALWSHVLFGVVAEVMGVYVVIRTKTEASTTPNKVNMRRIMALTLLFWIVALLAGIAFYFLSYF